MKKNIKIPTLSRLLSLALIIGACSITASALPLDHFASRSAMADGKWIKIKVTGEGIYRLTYAQLRDMGFSDPSAVNVYGWGGNALYPCAFNTTLGDDLPVAATYNSADRECLYFYGEGDLRVFSRDGDIIEAYRNEYHTAGYYFLSDRPAQQPADYPVQQGSLRQPFNYHLVSTWYEDEAQCKPQSGVFFHDEIWQPGESRQYTLPIRHYTTDRERWDKIYLNIVFACKNPVSTTEVVVTPPDIFAPYSWENPIKSKNDSETAFFTTSRIRNRYTHGGEVPDGDYTFTVTNVSSSAQTYFALDHVGFVYPQRTVLDDGYDFKVFQFLDVTAANDFIIENATPHTRVLNVTLPNKVFRHSTTYDASTGTLRGSFDRQYADGRGGPCRLIAFEPDNITLTPEIIGPVDNQDIHGQTTPQMVIITTSQFYDHALELAQAHCRHGLDTRVYLQDQVFNEFSSGTPHPFGYSLMCKMFYDRDPERFKYLLLYGNGVWDNRGLVLPQAERLLTYQCAHADYAATTTSSYTHDGFFGMLEDDFTHYNIFRQHHSIAVGRIPVADIAHATDVNRKLIDYLDNPPSIDSYVTAVAMSDDGNGNTHLDHSTSMISAVKNLQPSMTFFQAHNLVYPWDGKDAKVLRSVATAGFKQGAGLFAYSGHGEANGFAAEKLWLRSNVRSTTYEVPPLAVLATCTAFEFDHPDTDINISEAMLYQNNGGMIGVIGACRPVYMEYNQLINVAATKAYAAARTGTTVGDIYLQTMNDIMHSNTLSISGAANTLCYNLCGDPGIPITAPTYGISLTHLDDKALPEPPVTIEIPADTLEMLPMQTYTLKGMITDDNGRPVTDFNGDVSITVYESPRTVMTEIKNPDDKFSSVLPVTLDQDILSKATAKVRDGRFEAPFMTALPNYVGRNNRIVVTATDDDTRRSAVGFTPMVRVLDDNYYASFPGEGPEVTEMYLDTPDFSDGDVIGANPTLYLSVRTDQTGIRFGSGIGVAPHIRLDGLSSLDAVGSHLRADADDNTLWHLAMPVRSLTDGQHTLTFSAQDNAGRRCSRSISFNVLSSMTDARLTISLPDDHSQSSPVTLMLHTDTPIAAPRLIIEDALGGTVLSVAGVTFPYSWDLKDNHGNLVPDGHYSAFVIAGDESSRASTPRIEIPVIK